MSAPEDFKHNPAHTTLVFTEKACFSGGDFSYQLLLPLSGKVSVWLAEDVLAKERAQKPKTRNFGQTQADHPTHVVIKKATFEDYSSLLRLHGEYEALNQIAASPLRGRMHIQKPLKYVDTNTCKSQYGDLSNEPFLVLPFIKHARPLFGLCQTPGEALVQTYAPALFDILAVLEERQLIHRDISPNNLLVDEAGHLWLIDFGHVLHTSEANNKDIHALGSGTQGFMAPEVAGQGSNSPLTFAADQFSVARILLMLLTGELPDAFGQVQPQLNKVAADLRAVLQKAMTDNPQNRYASAALFCEAWSGIFAARVKTVQIQKQQESAKNTTQKQSQESNVFTAKRGDANYSKSQYLGLLGAVMMGSLLVFWNFPEKKSTTVTHQVIEPEMVIIPAGSFMMGDDKSSAKGEKPAHLVNIKSFKMMTKELTRGEFAQFVAAAGYKTDAERNVGGNKGCYVDYDGSGWKEGSSWRSVGFSQTDSHPAVCVSHNDAVAYAKWLSQQTSKKYRLPTEAEWEYAARAGTTTDYSFGASIGKNQANCGGCGSQWDNKSTAPVGSFNPNQFGLYDMHGNVWEWVQDCYHHSYKAAPTNGSAWEDGSNGVCKSGNRMLRGGSWTDGEYYMRSAGRLGNWPTDNKAHVGFRLAEDI